MVFALAIFLVSLAADDPPNLDGPQVVRAILGRQEGIHDLTLVFEGGFDFVGPEKLIAPRKGNVGATYQGTYGYRSDGSVLLETYNRSFLQPDSPLYIERQAVLRGQLESQTLNPDLRKGHRQIMTSRGSAGSLDMQGSASRIVLHWYFQKLATQQPPPAIMELAWEAVDGHQCLRFRVDSAPGSVNDRKVTLRFWVDLERGGNPLRIEWLIGEKLILRTSGIRLQEFPSGGGGGAWLATSGTTEIFRWGEEFYDVPIFRETYKVLDGSVRINPGLSDRAFRLETVSEVTGSPFLTKARDEFEGEAKRKKREPVADITPAGVQARLDRELAEANRQSRMLDASSAGGRDWPMVVQLFLGGLGVVALIIALWKRKAR